MTQLGCYKAEQSALFNGSTSCRHNYVKVEKCQEPV